MMRKIFYGCLLATIAVFGPGCKKTNDNLTVPPELATFAGQKTGTLQILANNQSYKIPVGVTTVSASPRTIHVSVSSPTGAVAGTHYTLASTTVTIPAGKAVDSLEVKGLLAPYTTGRKDSLIFKITEPGVAASEFNNTFTLILRGPCFEPNIVLSEMLGDYTNSNENGPGGPYGPYTTSIISATQVSPTTATIKVANIYDAGWNPITFTLDWTNPAARKVTLDPQTGIADAGTLSSAYAGMQVSVGPYPGQTGTFSYCNQTLTIKMQLGVVGLGVFTTPYTLSMAR